MKKSKYRIDPVPVKAISCNHVSADVTRGDRTKEDASTSQYDALNEKDRGLKKKEKRPLTHLIEAASYQGWSQKVSSDVKTG